MNRFKPGIMLSVAALACSAGIAFATAPTSQPGRYSRAYLAPVSTAVLCYIDSQTPASDKSVRAVSVKAELTKRNATCNSDTIAAGEARYAALARRADSDVLTRSTIVRRPLGVPPSGMK